MGYCFSHPTNPKSPSPELQGDLENLYFAGTASCMTVGHLHSSVGPHLPPASRPRLQAVQGCKAHLTHVWSFSKCPCSKCTAREIIRKWLTKLWGLESPTLQSPCSSLSLKARSCCKNRKSLCHHSGLGYSSVAGHLPRVCKAWKKTCICPHWKVIRKLRC